MTKTTVRAGATRRGVLAGSTGAALSLVALVEAADAASASDLRSSASEALRKLYARNSHARELGRRARGVLVFPRIAKAGFIFGGQGGEGVLFVGGKPDGYYSIGAASFGLQAGAQVFGYALFFITRSSLDYLRKSDGWAIGTGPRVVVLKEGAAVEADTTTVTQDVYAMSFNQAGLMASLSLEGSKISRIHPKG
jgi:lipid-binding SYLF domain-containing protein